MNRYLVTYAVGIEWHTEEVQAISAQAAADILRNSSVYLNVRAVHLLTDMSGEWN